MDQIEAISFPFMQRQMKQPKAKENFSTKVRSPREKCNAAFCCCCRGLRWRGWEGTVTSLMLFSFVWSGIDCRVPKLLLDVFCLPFMFSITQPCSLVTDNIFVHAGRSAREQAKDVKS